eukprot:COSAG05_NODE_261_length_12717_cov_4.824061_5_plen_91_part_00
MCTGLLRRDLAKSGRKRKGMFECAGQSTRWKTYNFVLQHDGRLSWSEYTSPRDSQSGGGGGACASSPRSGICASTVCTHVVADLACLAVS